MTITVVLTMGGRSARFRAAGYDVPKYRLKARGRTLLSWSLASLCGFTVRDMHLVAVGRADDPGLEDLLHAEASALGFPAPHLVVLDHQTAGQADTVLAAERLIEPHRPLLVWNVDTALRPGALHSQDWVGDGWVPCFPGRGDAWSFAVADDAGRVSSVREKVRVSDDATVGLYGFGSFSLLREAYDTFYGTRAPDVGETYVAPLYNAMIQRGRDVRLSRLAVEDVLPLGTPAELQAAECDAPPWVAER